MVTDMGRELKRVPMDFDYEMDGVWPGYCPSIETMQAIPELVQAHPGLATYTNVNQICSQCRQTYPECSEEAAYCVWYNDDLRGLWEYEPPVGDGYQLWETTTEGSPVSPVFADLESLCAWAADNATVFADMTATKEHWQEMLSEGLVYYRAGPVTFL
jgi:hypothetical protein